jgi:hypothetical protein
MFNDAESYHGGGIAGDAKRQATQKPSLAS